jgi:hypothetical protein
MEEQVQEYFYQLKPLIVPGGIYLISFPVFTAGLWYLLKLTATEIFLLLGIYLVTVIGILILWIYGRSQSFRVEDDQLVLKSLRGEQALSSQQIRRIALFRTRRGNEIVQIKTKSKDYYVTDQYFPFAELIVDLEQFVRNNAIRSNFTGL